MPRQQPKKKKSDPGHHLYEIGISILKHSKNENEIKGAYQFFANAADIGNVKAAEKIASALLFGNHMPQNITKAKQLYVSLANKGSHKAQTALGFMAATGIGMEYNPAKAVVYYTFGALGGNLISQLILGYRHWTGLNVPRNCEAALIKYRNVASKIVVELDSYEIIPAEKVKLMEKPEIPSASHEIMDWDIYQYYRFLAEKGDRYAQVFLGKLHLVGRRGLEQDYYKAYYYLTKAANSGSPNALALLGKMHLKGNAVVRQNNSAAIRYFTMAADRGNPIGLCGLGLIYLQGHGVAVNYGQAFIYFQKAAEKGFATAQFHLGIMYYSGFGVKKDYKTAFRYFLLASQSGHPLGIYNLAHMYATGTAVFRSCQTAVELYKTVCELGSWSERFLTAFFAYRDGKLDMSLVQYMLLAEMGYETAQSNAAYILESQKTNILSKDELYPMAFLLWNRAAAQGSAFARVKTGDYYFYGLGTKKDHAIAATHYKLASEQHRSAQALFNLAYMYEHGLGMEKDTLLARRLYDLAAEASPDAYVPVFFALIKLETVHLFRKLLYYNYTTAWKQLFIDRVRSFNWDLLLMMLITFMLVILFGTRYI
ncbi:protein sel-1 homolog 2 [Rhinatrema bivittatum]|uniref:protein sel-1 homolog 2 n=1 Tax=Rhinatrema bivittatum TaxID=194408 RepID=UPI00112D1238|nr:protein sel-1 homolog 2 [Rhinatrema bivittatum]